AGDLRRRRLWICTFFQLQRAAARGGSDCRWRFLAYYSTARDLGRPHPWRVALAVNRRSGRLFNPGSFRSGSLLAEEIQKYPRRAVKVLHAASAFERRTHLVRHRASIPNVPQSREERVVIQFAFARGRRTDQGRDTLRIVYMVRSICKLWHHLIVRYRSESQPRCNLLNC